MDAYQLVSFMYTAILISGAVSLGINILIGFGCKKMAENKGYKKTGVFIFLGIFSGLIGLIFTALLEPVNQDEEYKDRDKGTWRRDDYGSHTPKPYDPYSEKTYDEATRKHDKPTNYSEPRRYDKPTDYGTPSGYQPREEKYGGNKPSGNQPYNADKDDDIF